MPSLSVSPPAPNRRARHAIGTQYKLDHSSIGQTASRRGHCPLSSFRKSLGNRSLKEDRKVEVGLHGQFLFGRLPRYRFRLTQPMPIQHVLGQMEDRREFKTVL